ncbi:AAA family ATPase [Akkermansiaceae bacterium]|nr:AAA family ATPase [Akkermansiaceae bacterium]MDB4287787.1 AAA family ATPase [bacterium]MDA7629326.1 AAA family ATPase [Akkermansiaceae bacterium]MDA7864235.1 AAA family ATPase [Akkermansiaceae bacterium]MDA8967075.1 AAA family ATPase [Akkermansiaceae bacterium]
MDPQALQQNITDSSEWVPSLKQEISQVLVGQDNLVEKLLIGLLSHGHILLEGVPGLAKTLSIRALAGTLEAQFARVQFTPDLLPADLIGTLIYHPDEKSFAPKLGPIFANLVLADEINRAPAKVQAALLEAMQERQVTIGDKSYDLPDPFLVLATQNPIDQEGTYQLPEAQLDRFLLKVTVDYPNRDEELSILDRMASTTANESTQPIVDMATVAESRAIVDQIYIDRAVRGYIVDLVQATRDPAKYDAGLKSLIQSGASPRATINFALAARARAFLEQRAFVTPADIKNLAPEILRHRILLSYEAEAEGVTTDAVIQRLMAKVPVP